MTCANGQTDIVMGNVVPLKEKIKELEEEIKRLEYELKDALWYKKRF